MRGAYTTGVVDVLAEMGITFDAVYGTSAGGTASAWFAAGQTDVYVDSWAYVNDPRVMNYGRWISRRGPLLDMDHLIYHVYPNELGIDVKKVQKANHAVVVTATHVETARTRFFDLRDTPVLDALRATSALPLATSGPVRLDGEWYLDGGLSGPLPVARALADGHKEIVVVLNKVGEERRAEPLPFSWYFGRRFPALAAAGYHHHRIVNDAVRLADAPPDGVAVTVIRPLKEHGLTRFTRDMDRIHRGIEQGRKEARAVLA